MQKPWFFASSPCTLRKDQSKKMSRPVDAENGMEKGVLVSLWFACNEPQKGHLNKASPKLLINLRPGLADGPKS